MSEQIEIKTASALGQALCIIAQQPHVWNAIEYIRGAARHGESAFQREVALQLEDIAKGVQARVNLEDPTLDFVVRAAVLEGKRVIVMVDTDWREQDLLAQTVFTYQWRFSLKMRPAYVQIGGKPYKFATPDFVVAIPLKMPVIPIDMPAPQYVPIQTMRYRVKQFGYSFRLNGVSPDLRPVCHEIRRALQDAIVNETAYEVVK